MRPFAPQSLLALLGLSLALACSEGTSPSPTDAVQAPALRTAGRSGFGFNGSVKGFPTGEVRLTGGGSFDPATANNVVPTTETSVASAGGFDCTTPVAQGPLTGCGAGEGVRWDTVQLLASVPFRCTGSDAAKLAVTGNRTAVLLADFYRAGDGDEKSFTAQMIVSDGDLAPEIDGLQNLWVQGVGCGAAIVNFKGRGLVIE